MRPAVRPASPPRLPLPGRACARLAAGTSCGWAHRIVACRPNAACVERGRFGHLKNRCVEMPTMRNLRFRGGAVTRKSPLRPQGDYRRSGRTAGSRRRRRSTTRAAFARSGKFGIRWDNLSSTALGLSRVAWNLTRAKPSPAHIPWAGPNSTRWRVYGTWQGTRNHGPLRRSGPASCGAGGNASHHARSHQRKILPGPRGKRNYFLTAL